MRRTISTRSPQVVAVSLLLCVRCVCVCVCVSACVYCGVCMQVGVTCWYLLFVVAFSKRINSEKKVNNSWHGTKRRQQRWTLLQQRHSFTDVSILSLPFMVEMLHRMSAQGHQSSVKGKDSFLNWQSMQDTLQEEH